MAKPCMPVRVYRGKVNHLATASAEGRPNTYTLCGQKVSSRAPKGQAFSPKFGCISCAKAQERMAEAE